MPTAPPAPTGPGGIYNPSGHWSAYDTNVYESLNFPGRQAGDTTNNDPPGTNDPLGRFGYCAPDPQYMPQGRCLNHALEYLDYYEATMKEILKDFGGTVHRYEFENPGRSDVEGAAGEPGGLSSPGGQTFNIAGIVPGADHPEQEVIVSGHWDFTDAAHAAAWDSSEGHAEVMRMAKIMTDYWRATGTRPAVTVKFMPWAAEESGTYGSLDYVENYVAGRGRRRRIRGYFNVDPCAGAYPAFYHGNPRQPGGDGDAAHRPGGRHRRPRGREGVQRRRRAHARRVLRRHRRQGVPRGRRDRGLRRRRPGEDRHRPRRPRSRSAPTTATSRRSACRS